jgi:hypothetical protein
MYIKSISAFGLTNEQLATLSLTPSSYQTDSISRGAIYETTKQCSKAKCSRVTVRHFFHWSLLYKQVPWPYKSAAPQSLRHSPPAASGGPSQDDMSCLQRPYNGRWELRFWVERICAIERGMRVASA